MDIQLLMTTIMFTAVLPHGQSGTQMSGKVGGNVTLQTGRTGLGDSQVLWAVGSDHQVLANYMDGRSRLDHIERFRGRVQLDTSSGSLTIMDLNLHDSGVYFGQVINGASSRHYFNLTVVAADPVPPRSSAGSQLAVVPAVSMWLVVLGQLICA